MKDSNFYHSKQLVGITKPGHDKKAVCAAVVLVSVRGENCDRKR